MAGLNVPRVKGATQSVLQSIKKKDIVPPEIRKFAATLQKRNGDEVISQETLTKLFSLKEAKECENFPAKVKAILSDPHEVAIWIPINLEPLECLLEEMRTPSEPALRINQKLYKVNEMSSAAIKCVREWLKDVLSPEGKKEIARIRAFKGSDGESFLSLTDVKRLLSLKQAPGDALGEFNIGSKIEAVLNNPEEFAKISKFKDRVMGVYYSISKPLPSTIKANPTLWKS